MDELHPQEAVSAVLRRFLLPAARCHNVARFVLDAIDDGWAKLDGQWVRLEVQSEELDDDSDSPTYEQYVKDYRVVVG